MLVRIVCLAVVLLPLIAPAGSTWAQPVTGVESLLRAPSAFLPPDGQLRGNVGYLPAELLPAPMARQGVVTYSTSMAFLPRVEIGFRLNRKINAMDALGDRMLSVRVAVLRESTYRPALTLGAHDFLRSTSSVTTKFQSFYLVAGKQVPLARSHTLSPLMIVVGIAPRILSARGYEIAGVFGGVSVPLTSWGAVLAEYDGEHMNLGGRLRVGPIELVGAVSNFSMLFGGGSYRVQL